MSSIVTAFLNTLGYYKVKNQGGKFFYSIGDGIGNGFWGNSQYNKLLKNFIEIPELNGIINYRALAESRGKIQIINKNTGEAAPKHIMQKLLDSPNWFQSQEEYMRQGSIYRSVYGNEYEYALSPVGFSKSKKALFSLPPDMMYIYCPTKYFFLEPKFPSEIKYYFQLPGEQERQEIETASIAHLNDNRISYRPDKRESDMTMRTNYLYGTSKQVALSPNIENLKVAHEGRNTLRKLPVGILSNKAKDSAGTQPMNPDDKDDLQKDINKYGIEVDRNQLILTALTLGFEQTIVDISKLELYKEVEEDAIQIGTDYGVPPELVGKKDITYENKRYAERQMYQDTIIPSTAEKSGALTKLLGLEDSVFEVLISYDHLPIFQENVKERAQALNLLVSALNKALNDKAIDIAIYKKELSKFGI